MAAVHTLWAFQAQPATRELRQRQAHHADLNEADSSEDEIDDTSPLRDEGMVLNGLRASMTSGGLPHDMLALAEQAEDLSLIHISAVSYTHLTLPTNREV